MDEEIYEGRWRPLGDDSDPLTGTLKITNRLSLRLIGTGAQRIDLFTARDTPRPVAFVGESVNKVITLLGCQYTAGRSNLFGGPVDIAEYSALRALIGDYAPTDDNPRFDRLIFELTQLNYWANRRGFGRTTFGGQSRQYLETPVPSVEACVPGARIRLTNYLLESWESHFELHLRGGEQLEVELDEKLPISAIMEDYIGPLTALITLASGEASNITDICVADTSVTTDADSPRYLSLRLDWGSRATEEPKRILTPLMRFNLQSPEVSFETLLNTWFDLYSKIGSDCQLLFSLKGQNTIYPWNDLFKVASAAEGMHRKLNLDLEQESTDHKKRVKAIKNAVEPEHRDFVREALIGSHRPSFRSRLIALRDEVGSASSILTGKDGDKWASLVIGHRDDVAHSLGKTIEVANVDRVTSLMFTAQVLLELFLLRRLGFSEEYCEKLLREQPTWSLFVDQAHEHLSELFTNPETSEAG